MSTIVQMPVRVKPPPADTGETISPGCASFEIAMPLNGARMTVLSRLVRSTSICRSATRTCSRAACDARLERIDLGPRGVDVGLRRPARPRGARCRAPSVDLRLGEPHFVLADAAARGLGLRLGQRQRRLARVASSSRASTWPSRDGHAFLDVHLDDLAGDLRRHRRAPARRDVARRVQHGRLRAGAAQ